MADTTDTKVLHINAEPEPSSYHGLKHDEVAFGLTLSAEYVAEDPRLPNANDQAGEFLDKFLEALTDVRFFLYKIEKNNEAYIATMEKEIKDGNLISSNGGRPNQDDFFSWINEKNEALEKLGAKPHKCASQSIPKPPKDETSESAPESSQDEALAGATASVGQILMTMPMLDAPTGHRLGQCRVAIIDKSHITEGEQWAVILPYFETDPEKSPDKELIARQDKTAENGKIERFEIEYDPSGEFESVTARTSALYSFPDSEKLGVVDPKTGFVCLGETKGRLRRALARFEEVAASQLWVLPHLLEAAQPVEEEIFGNLKNSAGAADKEDSQEEYTEYEKWLIWLAAAGTITAFDPILHTLSPLEAKKQKDVKTEGLILAEIISRIVPAYHDEVEKYNLNKVKSNEIKPLIKLTEVKAREHVLQETSEIVGKLGENNDWPQLLQMLDLLDDPNDPDVFEPLHQALIAIKGNKEEDSATDGSKSKSFEFKQSEITQALTVLMTKLQEESGVEKVIEALLDPLFARDESRLAHKIALDLKLTSDEDKPQVDCIKKAIERVWQEVRIVLQGRFNGAEAVRRTTGEVYLKALVDDARNAVNMENCLNALKPSGESGTYIYATRLGLNSEERDTRLHKLSTRLGGPPDGYLTDQVKNALRGDINEKRDGLDTVQCRQAEEFFSDSEPDPADLRLMVPDTTPAPLSLQIANDIAGDDLAEFQKMFDGFGVLLRRIDKGKPNKWAHANLVELLHFPVKENGKPQYVKFQDIALRPLNPALVDGRMSLFIDYNGLPFSGAAFDNTQEEGAKPSKDEQIAFSSFVSVEDVEYKKTGDNEEVKPNPLPALAYGSKFKAAAFGVTKAGCLPKLLQGNKPWLPNDLNEDSPELPSDYPPKPTLTTSYRRRTAIGRVGVNSTRAYGAESEREISRQAMQAALQGVDALSNDYPRQSLASFNGQPGYLDLFRNTDGRGALKIPLIKDKKHENKKSIILKDVCWYKPCLLSFQFYALDWNGGAVCPKEISEAYTVELEPCEGFTDLEFTIDSKGAVCLSIHDENPKNAGQIDLKKIEEDPLWLRLTLKSLTDKDSTTISFATTTQTEVDTGEAATNLDLEYYARPDSPEVLLMAEESPEWNEGVPHKYVREISFPRVTYQDFDRWVANPNLRSGLWGLSNGSEAEVIRALQDIYIYRHLPDVETSQKDGKSSREHVPLKKVIDQLPDPAVQGLLIELIPQDNLTGKDYEPERKFLSVTLGDISGKIPSQKEGTLQQYKIFVNDEIDAKFKFKLEILAEPEKPDQPQQPKLNVAPGYGESGFKADKPRISVKLPPGISARLSIRPVVKEEYFSEKEEDFKPFEQGLLHHTPQIVAIPEVGADCAIFAGVEAVFEVMHADLGNHISDLRKLSDEVIVCEPGGPERSYSLQAIEPPDQKDCLIWRRISRIDILSQRWRFSGRPIYNWWSPPAGDKKQGNPVVEIAASSKSQFAQFEREAFYGRPDRDADRTTVRLEPVGLTGNPKPDGTTAESGPNELISKLGNRQILQTFDWGAPSATMFRHRYEMRSRYAAAMTRHAKSVVTSWESEEEKHSEATDDATTQEQRNPWSKRVVMLADQSRVELTRPQVRAFLPLTRAPQNDGTPRIKTPPVLSVLDERPLVHGGLADRVLGEIKTGIHFELPSGSSSGQSGDEQQVQPKDVRKEIGPEPRLYVKATNEELARKITLHQEGPIGLTFDTRNISAPAFANSQHLFHPTTLEDDEADAEKDDKAGAEFFEEHALGISLHRILDPDWTVRDDIDQKDASRDLNRNWFVKLIGSSDSKELKVFEVGEIWVIKILREGGKAPSVQINPKVLYDAKTDKEPFKLCTAPPSYRGDLAVLHTALGDGRYRATVLFTPNQADTENDSSRRIERGLDNTPRVLASVEWSTELPRTKNGELIRKLKVSGHSDIVPVSTSSPTDVEWITTARDSAALYYAGTNGLPQKAPVPVEFLYAVTENSDSPDSEKKQCRLKFKYTGKEADRDQNKDLWLLPKLGESSISKTLHRHQAIIGTTLSKGLGRRFEIYQGTALALSNSIDLWKGQPPEQVRIVEYETPALPLCSNWKNPIPPQYRKAYFDLLSSGGTNAKEIRFLIRPVRDIKDLVKSLTFRVHSQRKKGESEGEKVTLNLNETSQAARAAYIEMIWSFSNNKYNIMASKITSEGEKCPVMVDPIKDFSPIVTPGIMIESLEAKDFDDPLWCDISILHRSDQGNGFDFNWVFSSSQGEDTPEQGTRFEALNDLVEAQARIVAVSPPIIVKYYKGE